eukprot:TRINITY_DN17032_c0_g1_i1.p2 TRINITY_DN17032_c0_g1~~TRINITY_DN17032_c0_g1_i1.p2  ORF type:complete len:221 (+),score=31.85 TRINITY_DN17032_c0_g1_i1:67-729(+)
MARIAFVYVCVCFGINFDRLTVNGSRPEYVASPTQGETFCWCKTVNPLHCKPNNNRDDWPSLYVGRLTASTVCFQAQGDKGNDPCIPVHALHNAPLIECFVSDWKAWHSRDGVTQPEDCEWGFTKTLIGDKRQIDVIKGVAAHGITKGDRVILHKLLCQDKNVLLLSWSPKDEPEEKSDPQKKDEPVDPSGPQPGEEEKAKAEAEAALKAADDKPKTGAS